MRHNREGNPAVCDHMGEPGGIMISEISQKKKDGYCMVSLTCGYLKEEEGEEVGGGGGGGGTGGGGEVLEQQGLKSL